jgi:signal transduction histidine kinase
MRAGSLLLIILFYVNLAYAVTDTVNYARQHFTDENGLPQNSVKFISPDKAGFVWLGTENGLVRYEGGDYFRTFNKNELPVASSRISYMCPGSGDAELLACTEHKELLRIRSGKVCIQDPTGAEADGYQYFDFNDNIDGTYSLTGLPNLYENNISSVNYQLPLDAYSYFLVGRNKVSFIAGKDTSFSIAFPHTSPWKFFLLNNRLHYLDEAGQLIAFNGAAPAVVPLTGDILRHPAYIARHRDIKLYWNFSAKQLFFYLDGTCYLLQYLPDGRLNTLQVMSDFDFEANRIITVYYDTANSRLFLGSLTRGLFIFTRQIFRVLYAGGESDDEVYYAQARYGNDRVLTSQGMVFGREGYRSTLPLLKEKSRYGDRFSIVTDRQGYIWYKSKYTLYKFNNTCTRQLWMWTSPSNINQLYLASDGRLWIGTGSSGLYSLSTTDSLLSPQLFSSRLYDVSYMQQETPDLLWLGAGKGLYRLRLSTQQIDTIHSFNNRYIRSLYIPKPGQVWITTYDNGFFLYRNNRLTSFPLDRDKYLATAHCFVQGNQGYAWITTNKGLFQASVKDLLAYADGEQSYVYYQYYGKDKGFNTNEFNGGCQPCAINWPNGSITLPSLEGLVYFRPDAMRAELPDKPLFIELAELDGKRFPYEEDTFTLPHAFRQLKLRVSVPYFGDPYNLQLTYALTGADQDTVWLPLATDHTLSFSTLPSGTYRLHIRKIDGFGKNNYSDKVLMITVSQAYYETTWFRLLMVLFGAIVVVVYSKAHTYNIKQQNLELESRVSARTAQLQSTMASLSLSEKKLRRQARTQERLLASITHDIKTPMKYLMMLAGNLSWKEQNKMEPEMMVRSSKAIYDASYRMYYLIDNLIQYIKTHVKNGSAVPEEIDMHELLEEKIDIFESIAETNNNVIINQVPPGLQFRGHYQVLAVVIHNLLDNAVKNTREGEITVSADCTDHEMTVRVEDTGTGLPPSLLHWINNYQYTGGKEEEAAHNGMGLLIVMELLEQVNGRLTAENKPHCGAVMKVIISC